MSSNNPNKWTIADVLANFGKRQAEVQQEKQLKDQLKQALMQNQAQALGQFVPGMQQQMSPQEEMSMEQAYQQAKRGGIHLDPAKKGTFKAQATRMGMGVQEAAAHILANRDNYSSAMIKKANFARNFAKEEGGTINNPGFNALPDYVQNKILNNMEYGGDMYRKGGEMIKRADGSYSQRGLWDNIRANKGSGRKPTREMIEQERKLRRKAMGGMMCPSDCKEGYEWDDTYQVCVPIEGTVTPESLETTAYMKNWYDKRPEILTDPNYINAISDPEIPSNTKFHINRLKETIPLMQQQYSENEEGQPLTPIEYTGPLANPDAVGEHLSDENGGMGSIRVRKD